MAFYDYECTDCKHQWEAEHSINAEPLKICPACNKETAKRLISMSSFVLVGGGWGSTGYSNK